MAWFYVIVLFYLENELIRIFHGSKTEGHTLDFWDVRQDEGNVYL